MTAELIVGIAPETLEALAKIAANTIASPNHAPLERFAALMLNGIAENIKSDLPDGVGTVVFIPAKVLEGFSGTT